MNYGFQWIESEARAHGCEVVKVTLNRCDDRCEVVVSAQGVRGEMFGVVMMPGDLFRSAIAASYEECERMVRYETKRVAQRTKSTAELDPGVLVVEILGRCPHHDTAHVVMFDGPKWKYRCSADEVHKMPDRWAWFDDRGGKHVVEERP